MFLDGCSGCKVCMSMCGFHHSSQFNPAKSSILVSPSEKGFSVEIIRMQEGERQPCDRCAGLEERLCVKYCPKLKCQDLLRVFHETSEKEAGDDE